MSSISWIGLGDIGSVVCKNLIKYRTNSAPVTIWNRTHQKAVDFLPAAGITTSDGVTVSNSLADAITASDIICICLLDDAAVREVIANAIASADVRGKLFVDLSTNHPDTAAEQFDKLRDNGAEYLASPIFGGVPLAITRQITLVLAGSLQAIEKFSPFTDGVICKNTITLPDQPCQQACLLKLIGNFIRLSTIEVLCEASVLSEKAGLSQETLQKFTEALIPGPATAQLKMLQSGDYYKLSKPAVPISMVVKENAHLNDVMQKNGTKSRMLDTLTSLADNVEETRGPGANLMAIFGVVREESGLPFEN